MRNFFKIHKGITFECSQEKTVYGSGIRLTRQFLRDAYYNKACSLAEHTLDALASGNIAEAQRKSARLNRLLSSLEKPPPQP